MAYIDKEDSVQDGQPIELHRFSNSEEVFLYTNGPDPVTYNFETYDPIAISRSSPKLEQVQESRDMRVQVGIRNAFALRYILDTPASLDRYQMFRQHSTDLATPQTIQIFEGDVTRVQFNKNEAEIHIKNVGSILERLIPRQTTRNACNHILYNTHCGAAQGNFSMVVEVTNISEDGQEITVDGGTNTITDTGLQLSAQITDDSAYFLGGVITRGGIENRMVRISTNPGGNISVLTVSFHFQILAVGDPLILSAGCDLSFPVCGTRFDNKLRYGGFPFIPNKNLFETGVEGD
jgi:hypothetical protein